MYRRLYRSLYRIRRVEEEIARIYPSDKIKSPVHLAIGQEAVAVGVCEALRTDDVVFGTYRSHAVYLAKGGDLRRMMAELYGKRSGCCRGKGGSMHLIDLEAGVMGTSAIVGTHLPQAVGYAYAVRLRQEDRVVACIFGDGAVDEGVFHESLNFAALKRLPVVFVCENNFYAIHSHQRSRQANPDICEQARSYGIAAERIEDGDVLRIYERVRKVVEEIRRGNQGPFFFECRIYRWKEHVGPNDDFHTGYRSLREAEPWMARDPVRRLAELLDPKERAAIEADVEEEIREAIAFAEADSFPADYELYADLFKGC